MTAGDPGTTGRDEVRERLVAAFETAEVIEDWNTHVERPQWREPLDH